MFPRDCEVGNGYADMIQLGETPAGLQSNAVAEGKVAQAIGGSDAGDDDLEARMAGLRR